MMSAAGGEKCSPPFFFYLIYPGVVAEASATKQNNKEKSAFV